MEERYVAVDDIGEVACKPCQRILGFDGGKGGGPLPCFNLLDCQHSRIAVPIDRIHLRLKSVHCVRRVLSIGYKDEGRSKAVLVLPLTTVEAQIFALLDQRLHSDQLCLRIRFLELA